MKQLLKLLVSGTFLKLLGLLALAIAIWWIGPIVAVGRWKPLEPWWSRAAVIATAGTLVLGRMAWRHWRKRRAEAALAEGITAPKPAPGEEDVARNRENLRKALALLRSTQRGPWWRGDQSLYEVPWYLFIGDSGSGKTTALVNSGLSFPLAAKLGQDSIKLKGVGGTRNCDWWFTDKAVLIDTAGRYSTQQSDATADAAGWLGFLALLRKHRPRRPINGVLLTIDVKCLLEEPAAYREQVAAQLRARLQELSEHLGVRAPIYVLVTKADLIAGFNESFQHLGKEEREQVFGMTFALEPQGDALAQFDSQYQGLVQRLCDQLLERLQTARDVLSRSAIFCFPQQFAALQPVLRDMLRQIFAGSGRLDEQPLLRGVYFTSGTQEGTPIDRVLGELGRAFKLEQGGGSSVPSKGKSFFVHRLLHDVVFTEQELVSRNRKMEWRRTATRTAAFSAIALVSLAFVGGWSISAWRNASYVRLVESRLPGLTNRVNALPATGSDDVAAVATTLTEVRDAAAPEGFPLRDPPLLSTLGLYQGEQLDLGARTAYRNLLHHVLLPRLQLRLEQQLRSASRDDLEFAYEALKHYLMMHTPTRVDPEALKAWIQQDWNTQLETRVSAQQRTQLNEHLDALLKLGLPREIGPIRQPLVDEVRSKLASVPVAERVYSRLKRLKLGQELREFTLAGTIAPEDLTVFERVSGAPLTSGVPGLYTRAGYHQAFNPAVQKAVAQIADEETWVLRVAAAPARGSASADDRAGIESRVRNLYLDDYIKVWDRFLDDVRVARPSSIDRGIQIAALLAKRDSGLEQFVVSVVKETTLAPAAPAPAASDTKARDGSSSKAEDLKRMFGKPAPAAAPAAPSPTQEERVDRYPRFVELRRLTEGQPPPLETVRKQFDSVLKYLEAVQSSRRSKSPAPSLENFVTPSERQPPLVQSVLAGLVESGQRESDLARRQSDMDELRSIAEFCQRSISGRYPIASGSQSDVLPANFGTLFGFDGLLDDFYKRRLATVVDAGRPTWSYKPSADGTRQPGPSLVDFQRAARIREVFFPRRNTDPAFQFDIRVVALSEGLSGVDLDIDGQVLKLDAAAPAVTVSWPSTRVDSELRLIPRPAGMPQVYRGPWALFRLFDSHQVQATTRPEKFQLVLNVEGRSATLEVTSHNAFNPYRLAELRQFRCPGAL